MKRKFTHSIIVTTTFIMGACTQPGEMTSMGAAAGGVVGAGLGAIVGSQTGSAGAGLAIGAVAGSGAGAAVGNVLEAQDQAIRQQDEAIERQEQVIRAQRGEIDELRRLGQDSVRFRSKPGFKGELASLKPPQSRTSTTTATKAGWGAQLPTSPARVDVQRISQPAPFVGRAAPVAERAASAPVKQQVKPRTPEIAAKIPPQRIQSNDMTGVASLEEETTKAVAEESSVTEQNVIDKSQPQEVTARVAPQKSEPASADCLSAESEYQQAEGKNETPDKLFHLRRALRLCPDEPRFHSKLGDVYKILGRQSDAQFEYQEALRLSPGNPEVKDKLSALGGAVKEQY